MYQDLEEKIKLKSVALRELRDKYGGGGNSSQEFICQTDKSSHTCAALRQQVNLQVQCLLCIKETGDVFDLVLWFVEMLRCSTVTGNKHTHSIKYESLFIYSFYVDPTRTGVTPSCLCFYRTNPLNGGWLRRSSCGTVWRRDWIKCCWKQWERLRLWIITAALRSPCRHKGICMKGCR